MPIDPRFIANATLIAAPTLTFLVACTVLLLMTGPSRAAGAEPMRVELRGGESVEVPGAGRAIRLSFTRVVSDGLCAARRPCVRAGSPVVEIRSDGGRGPATFRLSPAAHLAAPFVPVQGRFVTFGELVAPPRELSSAGRMPQLSDYVLRLTVSP